VEAIAIAAVGYDLETAAHLIPILHKLQRKESMAAITQKIGPWRDSIRNCSPGTGVGQTPSSNTQTSTSGMDRRKRQRDLRSGDTSRDRDQNDSSDDDHDDPDPKRVKGNAENGRELPRLACFFNKRDPAKYRVRHDATEGLERTQYRTCEGPGFATIQRLK
jgi:hypothetical protein